MPTPVGARQNSQNEFNVLFQGSGFTTFKGKQLSVLGAISTPTYTIGPANYGMTLVVTYSAGNCAITWPA